MFFKKNKINTFIKIFSRGFKGYKKQILVLAGLGFLSSMLEGIGINAAIPLFSLASGTNNPANDTISKLLKNTFNFLNINFNLKYLFILICLLFIFRVILLIYSNYIRIKISASYEEHTRSELFKLTLDSNWPYLLKQKIGHLETILITNVQYGSNLLQYISNSIISFISLIVFFLVAINISWIITFVTVLLGIIIFFVFKPLLYKVRTLSREKEKINRQTSHFINENIIGLKTIKVMSSSDIIIEKAREYFKRLKELIVKTSLLSIITSSLIQPIGLIYVFFVFAISYKMQTFNFASLIAIVYLIQRIFTYGQQLQSYLYSIVESTSYINKMLDYNDEIINNVEKKDGYNNFNFNNNIEFKNIEFYYNKNKEILKGINFVINKGEMVGLIGPSGSGKTTIVDLILRLFNPTKGEILIDGKGINNINISDWRKKIGYVSQDIFLKNDTIANNIKFYDDRITDEKIELAAKMANIYDLIQSYPNKYDTIIGDRGLLLSVGQRQRIIIARILARNPEILILDEATSALDNESELQIQKVIENLKNKVTVLLIAHRLSTVKNCSKLLVIHEGKVIEQGTPEGLLKNENSYYYKVNSIRN